VRVGVIGGNGWLGGAMASAWIAAGVVDPERLALSSRSGRRGAFDAPGVRWTQSNGEVVSRCDVIFIAVRPEQFDAVEIDARDKLIVSVMAGVPSAAVAARTKADRVVRAMPNAAASLRKSFTPWCASAAATGADKALAQRLLAACGEAEEVMEEAHIDYCVGLTGSGAAFPALLARAMTEAALARGLPPAFARRAALGVVADASQLLRGLTGGRFKHGPSGEDGLESPGAKFIAENGGTARRSAQERAPNTPRIRAVFDLAQLVGKAPPQRESWDFSSPPQDVAGKRGGD
jgi:pyrroline-5-carboxylate reductase